MVEFRDEIVQNTTVQCVNKCTESVYVFNNIGKLTDSVI